MSDENCLSSSENFRNHPKTRYSLDFDIGPIEYIYVCVVHGQVKKIKTYIWLETISIIEHE
jgi:hypothetical protein